MKNVMLLCLLVYCVVIAQMCTSPAENADQFTSDPIMTVGHGAIIDVNGKEINPDEKFIEKAQQFYIGKLLKQKAIQQIDSLETIKSEINRQVDDKILGNALLIDVLLERSKDPINTQIFINNNVLRWRYVSAIQKNPLLPKAGIKWAKGVKPEVAENLKKFFGNVTFMSTNKSGKEYCDECVDAGVPIPKFMFGDEWKKVGEITREFISTPLQAELLIYENNSSETPGVCLALPRYPTGSNRANLFGVICMSKRTGKVCFFDTPMGATFTGKQDDGTPPIDFKQWAGGAILNDNVVAGGMCTDCHAGENPFIVHPRHPVDDPTSPFTDAIRAKLEPVRWYIPLVHPTWLQNPGPSNLLEAIVSDRGCDGCHGEGSGRRFPEISTRNEKGYCFILKRSLNRLVSPTKPTMPYGDLANVARYINHITALEASCGLAPAGDGVIVQVNRPDNPSFISPPTVIGPLYECATVVGVRGLVLNAKVKLFKNGTLIGTIAQIRDPDRTEFTGLAELRENDKLHATQTVNGTESDKSSIVNVRKFTVDYPAGLPAPSIDPITVYECASKIAVRHVQGAKITVYVNGINPSTTTGGSTGWTVVTPNNTPFRVGDKISCEISLCGTTSPRSASVRVGTAPASLAMPTIEPATIFDGQELLTVGSLTNGSTTTIDVVSVGTGQFSWPLSVKRDYDIKSAVGRPLRNGDILILSQQLCIKGPKTPRITARKCNELPAPQIERPMIGDDFVVVKVAIAGARIRVYDASGTEMAMAVGSLSD